MQFTTSVGLPAGRLEISHKNRIMLIGSCFAGNIGAKLFDMKFHIETNPFGVQYNPLSITTVLERVADGTPFGSASPELFEHGGKWHSMLHHSDFSRNSKEELIENINSRLEVAHKAFTECDTLIITLGTAYAYLRKSDNSIVGNCHKLPGSMFTRKLLGVDEIVSCMAALLRRCFGEHPDMRVIFTVSPIRHLKDGAHDNQKSKSTLMLAIDSLESMFPDNVSYFPAYEIMLDELRDYRFYADDMLHPSPVAVEYIWQCFCNSYFSDATTKINASVEEIVRALSHRPFDPSSPAHKRFLEALVVKIEQISAQYPYLDFQKETALCNTQLNR